MGNDRSPEIQYVWRHHFYNVQKQVTLNLKQQSGLNSNHRYYYASSAYRQVLNTSDLKWLKKPWEIIFSNPQGQLPP